MARVLINEINEYPMSVLAETLQASYVGSTAEDWEEPEEPEDRDSRECYTVTGTLRKDRPDVFDDQDILPQPSKAKVNHGKTADDLLPVWLQHDVIIYSVTDDQRQSDQATLAIETLHSHIDDIEQPITFVLLTSCLSWSRTKPADPEDPDVPFTEDEYRRRKPHFNFKPQNALEKLVLKCGRTDRAKLSCYVVCAGLIYGKGEKVFHSLFKEAWNGMEHLEVLAGGEGILPTIHVTDLCSVIRNIVENKGNTRFILAVDDSNNTQREVVQAISDYMGTGKIVDGSQENALSKVLITQADFDQLTVNLRLDATSIKEAMAIEWVAESGIIENLPLVADEYRVARRLLPLRVAVLGPPAVGKTTLAKYLCDKYKVHHIHMKGVIEQNLDDLRRSIARIGTEGLSDEDEAEALLDRDKMDNLEESKTENGGRYNDDDIIGFFKKTLNSAPCRNQGYILDGFPKTMEQAQQLFGPDEEAEEESEASYNAKIIPEVILRMTSSDSFLKWRVRNLPEAEVAKSTHYSEERFLAKVEEFRSINTDDNTVVNFFDELEIHPDDIQSECISFEQHHRITEAAMKKIGPARNYGMTALQRIAKRRLEEEAESKRLAAEAEERKKQLAKEEKQRVTDNAVWNARLAEIRLQEEENLAEKSAPMRDYLMKHVMPALNAGMAECAKVRPDDPVDFLAQYLFQHNPEPKQPGERTEKRLN